MIAEKQREKIGVAKASQAYCNECNLAVDFENSQCPHCDSHRIILGIPPVVEVVLDKNDLFVRRCID